MTKADILARLEIIIGSAPYWIENSAAWRKRELERLQLDLEIELRRERETAGVAP